MIKALVTACSLETVMLWVRWYLLMNRDLLFGVILALDLPEIVLQPTPALTFRAIGGILDLYLFVGPSPVQVIEQYTSLIGKPALPPFWSLGYHQCKFGQTTLNQTQKILEQTMVAKIPIDTQWNDLDYMSRRNDFTLDTDHFKDLPKFVAKLHEVPPYSF